MLPFPQNVHVLIPRTCESTGLHAKRDAANGIKISPFSVGIIVLDYLSRLNLIIGAKKKVKESRKVT